MREIGGISRVFTEDRSIRFRYGTVFALRLASRQKFLCCDFGKDAFEDTD